MRTKSAFDEPGCVIHGRHFVQRGNQWVDCEAEKKPNARRVRVRFDSREFFELIIKHPKTLSYVSTARNIQLAVEDIVYEIYE